MTENVTILVPTYNRTALLERAVGFLQRGTPRLPILVADGSDDDAASSNEEVCRRLGSNIEYFHMSPAHDSDGSVNNYLRRFATALDKVKTPFVACCADDDLLVPETAAKAADFLAEHPDYVGCQGVYLSFRDEGRQLRIGGRILDGPSVDGEEIGSRLMQFYSRYEPPYYAVLRTAVQQDLFRRAQDVTTLMLVEVFHSAAVVVTGKLKRLPDIYYLRNLGVPAAQPRLIEGWNQWMARDFDDVFEHYRLHRGKIMDLIASSCDLRVDLQSLKRALDMSFMVYVGREFHMSYWVEEYLATAIADKAEQQRLRQQLSATLLAQPGYSTLASAIKSSVKGTIKRALGENGVQLARRHINPVMNFAEMISIRENPLIRAPRGLVALQSEADWRILGQRFGID